MSEKGKKDQPIVAQDGASIPRNIVSPVQKGKNGTGSVSPTRNITSPKPIKIKPKKP